jgi:c-di-AMP phosphodiesterase-like protein
VHNRDSQYSFGRGSADECAVWGFDNSHRALELHVVHDGDHVTLKVDEGEAAHERLFGGRQARVERLARLVAQRVK